MIINKTLRLQPSLLRILHQSGRTRINKRVFGGFSHGKQKQQFPRIEWFYIPAGVGFGLICVIQIRHIWKREQKKLNPVEETQIYDGFRFEQWQIDLMKKLPTRLFSRVWGYCCDLHLPVWLRRPLINTYSYIFECNLDEALISDPAMYETFNKFFTRKLKHGTRIVDPTATVVSPADSTVLTFGCVDTHHLELEQVKGLSYPLKTFVGPSHPFYRKVNTSFTRKNEQKIGSCPSQEDEKDEFKLCYCTLYLGPGDYHWFHSPAEWTVEHRRHIPGHLFSVNPKALKSIMGIFNFNERILLSGHWEHGLFLYGAIGAYNVGSIKLNFSVDKDLSTNSAFWEQKFKDRLYSTGEILRRGDSIGRFELGSSLVLIFTAPKDFKFNIIEGQKLKYGEPLGQILTSK